MGEHGFNHNPHLTLHAHVQAVHEEEEPVLPSGAVPDNQEAQKPTANRRKPVEIIRKPVSDLTGIRGIVGPSGGGVLVRKPVLRRPVVDGVDVEAVRKAVADRPSLTLDDNSDRFSSVPRLSIDPVQPPKPLTNVQGFFVTQSVPLEVMFSVHNH